MPAAAGEPTTPAPVREIACDESGSEGDKLVGGTTDVFAHASVDVTAEVARAAIDRLRAWTRSPAVEYKASVVLRQQNRAALRWLLGPAGPLHGRAHVRLVEKERWLADHLGALLPGPAYDAGAVLYACAPRVLGREGWNDLLTRFNDLMRAHDRAELALTRDRLVVRLGALAPAANGSRVGELLARTATALAPVPGRPDPLARLASGDPTAPRLDPLLPAVLAAARHWSADGPVLLVHDQHHALTRGRVAALRAQLPPGGSRFVGVTLVDSQDDARVQLADLLAGAGRRLAAEALHGRADHELLASLRPYLDPASVWGEPRSGALLLGTRQASRSADDGSTSSGSYGRPR